MNTAPFYGQAFSQLRDAAGESWQAYTHHAFVEGLKNGTLPETSFLHYLRQDYVFLIHFSRAWALAVVKGETHQEMLLAAQTVQGLLEEEMPLHIQICKNAGISQAELFATTERPENLAYTRFVLETGYSGDLLALLAALAPCVMGHGEIGARLAQEAQDTPYQPWIDTYASEGYQQVCIKVGALLEDALKHRYGAAYETLPIWQTLCQKFTTATRLEVAFWQMGLTP